MERDLSAHCGMVGMIRPVLPPSLEGREVVGGKGHQLLALVAAGQRVPPFLVLPTAVGDELTRTGELPASTMVEVFREVDAWSPRWLAVRSSVTGEDGQGASFAGLFETFLYVTREQLVEKIKDAYQAIQSDRVRAYCREKHITQELKMAVVIQKMLDPRVAGVAFSRSPVAPTADVVIDAAWGVGEGVVSGLVETDHWRVSRLEEILIERIAEKKTALGANPLGGTRGVGVPTEKQKIPCLKESEVNELVKETLRLEKKRGHPIDVEWAYEDDRLYFLQVRPITQAFPPLKSYTDTNLTESYPGVVSPFTASFVKIGYRNVFAESAVLLGASGTRLEELMGHYQSLVAEVGHHLYYDLEHYYAVLSALPGGKKNIENWHRMIGGKKEGMEVPELLAPLGIWEQVKALLKLVRLILAQDRVLGRFSESLEVHKKIIREKVLATQSAQETFQLIHSTLARPMGFGLTALNDVILMLGVKGLSALLASQGKGEEVLAPMLKTGEEVESLKPLRALKELIADLPEDFWPTWVEATQNAELWGDIYGPIWEQLRQKGWGREATLLAGFLASYGDRSFEELKLESPTLRQSPGDFLRLMQFMRQAAPEHIQKHQKLEFSADSFTGWRRWAWKVCWKMTKRSIHWREHTRLLRGQFFNLVREMVVRGAEQLRADFPAFHPFKRDDFFNPSMDDYLAFSQGRMNEQELVQLMKEKAGWQAAKGPFAEFLVAGFGELPLSTVPVVVNVGDLIGQTAAQGKVTGRPLVLESPTEAMEYGDLSDCILVTRHTDPAWVYIMSQCRGLISEKGSLLSHTAIIGRELSIPTLVGVRGAVNALRDVERITLDADAGKVEISGH
jgi:rifampicin phosphotransferase